MLKSIGAKIPQCILAIALAVSMVATWTAGANAQAAYGLFVRQHNVTADGQMMRFIKPDDWHPTLSSLERDPCASAHNRPIRDSDQSRHPTMQTVMLRSDLAASVSMRDVENRTVFAGLLGEIIVVKKKGKNGHNKGSGRNSKDEGRKNSGKSGRK